MSFNTCRICKQHEEPLFKYGVRHYAHASCGFQKFGRGFVDRLPLHRVEQLPFRVLESAGFTLESIAQYVRERRARERG